MLCSILPVMADYQTPLVPIETLSHAEIVENLDRMIANMQHHLANLRMLRVSLADPYVFGVVVEAMTPQEN